MLNLTSITLTHQAIGYKGDIPQKDIRKQLIEGAVAGAIANWSNLEIKSAPGIGTSWTLFDFLKGQRIPYREFRLLMFDPYVLNPFQYIAENGEIKSAQYDLRKSIGLEPTGKAIIVLDEFDAASPTVQEYFNELVMEDILLIKVSRT